MDDEKFVMFDEDGIEREARILNKLEINNQEYLIYALSINDDEDSIYVSKLVKNGDEEEIVNIEDDKEREMVNSVVKEYINNL